MEESEAREDGKVDNTYYDVVPVGEEEDEDGGSDTTTYHDLP